MRRAGGKPGTPGRRTRELGARLAELGLDPLDRLAEIVQDPATEAGLRAEICPDLRRGQ